MKKFFKITAIVSGLAILSAGAVLADEMAGQGTAKPAMTPAAAPSSGSSSPSGQAHKAKVANPSSASGHGQGKKKIGKKAVKAAKEKYVWVCPMGDYSGPRTKDGKCPNCQMDLEKQKVTESKPAEGKTDKKM